MKLKSISICFVVLLLAFLPAFAQTDSTQQNNDLLAELAQTNEQTTLLPTKMIVTQRLLWGKKGLMRGFGAYQVTPERREVELKIRRVAVQTHQILGFVTLGGMIAQGVVGSRLYNGEFQLKELHENLATGINIGYFTTAGLSLFAPPKLINDRKGLSPIKLHKWLALLHFSGMVLTNVLAEDAAKPEIRPWHRAAAFTAFGAYAASIVVIKF